MSTFEIKMPKLGESITEGTIITWSVKVGDAIQEDDILFEVTTAKVNAEVPSPVEGIIVEILYNEGDTVEVGNVVARVKLVSEEEVDEVAAPEATALESTDSEAAGPEATKIESAKIEPNKTVSAKIEPNKTEAAPVVPAAKEEAKWYSPAVLHTAKEAGIAPAELEKLSGTGYLGRLSKKDVVNYIEQKKNGSSSAAAPQKRLLPVPPPMPSSLPTPAIKSFSGEAEFIEMDPVARIIADRMVQSKKISAHVTTVVEVDVTKLVNWRKREKDAFQKQEGISLTYMPAIVEATTKALKDFPKVNASVEGTRFVLKKHINMGIAVSLDDGNLIVPVIHDADKLSLSGVAHSIDTLAIKARSSKLKLEEIEGGTFTITNFGTFRNLIGTPIINQPEVAILGVGYIEKKPAVIETPEGDVIAIRHKMYLSLTYDHRIINGAMGGAFVKRIADYLENWRA
ncbi:MAG: dihydrolipoamide acetyltransferase family protein [Bacteroidia bacterium]|nr:dihydrolipoamide acetyltransferase family protein [Bacteroidia bacterium]